MKLFFWLLLGATVFVYAGFSALSWYVRTPHTPDLTRDAAKRIISARPEFNRTREIVEVSTPLRGQDSLKDCCYDAQFTFVTGDSTILIVSQAQFQFWNDSWHLTDFTVPKESGYADLIHIESDPRPQDR